MLGMVPLYVVGTGSTTELLPSSAQELLLKGTSYACTSPLPPTTLKAETKTTHKIVSGRGRNNPNIACTYE
jgi:hypothetical protein